MDIEADAKLVRALPELPAKLAAIPEQVAAKTGMRVKLQEPDAALMAEFPELSRAKAVLDIDPRRNGITIWANGSVDAHTLGHEFLHLKRDILDEVPKLLPVTHATAAQSERVMFLEGELEHLLIVPEEIRYFPEANAWWAEHYRALLARKRASLEALLLAWCFLRLVLGDHEDLLHECAKQLQSYGNLELLRTANNYRQEMENARPDKIAMIRLLLELLPKQTSPTLLIGRYVMRNGRLDRERLIA